MSNVSYLRTPAGDDITVYPGGGRRGLKRLTGRGGSGSSGGGPRRRRRAPWFAAGGLVLVVLAVLAAGAIVVSTSKPSFSSDSTALAKVNLPTGGGSVQDVVATTGPNQHERFVRLIVKGDPVVYPARKLAAGTTLTLTATVRRPGWISWLTGKTARVTRQVTIARTSVRSRFVTLKQDGDLVVHFSKPVRTISYGATPQTVRRHTLKSARESVVVPHTGTAGTMYVSGTVQRWETSDAASVSWFPTGTKATAVSQPSAGRTIDFDTPITLTFSKPVATVLGHHLPTVTPSGGGHWTTLSGHAIRYVPTGAGWGLGQKVSVALPAGVRLAGATQDGSASTGSWTVPQGSTVRLQQMLAQLGYLPLSVRYSGAKPARTLAGQMAAAIHAPAATLSWTYADTPSNLKSQWDGAGTASELTKGALMKFQDDHDLNITGYEDTETWNALIQAMIKNDRNTFGYTFVSVHEASSDESLFVWHSGRTVLSNIPVNTGISAAPTATGTFAVFEHVPVTTMTGTNPDGSHYSDPNIHWVSYFNGGDALHEFLRGSYGFPQSLGCVEMSMGNAGAVYPFTPIGTIVQVAT